MGYVRCRRNFIINMKRMAWLVPLVFFIVLCYYRFADKSATSPKNAQERDRLREQKIKQLESLRDLIDHGGSPPFMDIQSMEKLLYDTKDMKRVQQLRLNNLKTFCEKHPEVWRSLKEKRIERPLMAKRHFEKYGVFYSSLKPYKYFECRVAKAGTTARSFILWAAFHEGRNIHDFPYYHPVNDPEIVKMNSLKGKELQNMLANYFGAIYVREPLDKIISAYFNKFCDPDQKPEFKSRFGIESSGTPSLGEVLKILAKEEASLLNEEDDHFTSYFKYCNPCLSNFSFVGRFESHTADLGYMIYNKTSLHKGMSYAIDEAPVSPKFHDCPYEKHQPEAFADVDISDVYKLIEIHKHDYEAFGYNPQDMINYMEKRILQAQSTQTI